MITGDDPRCVFLPCAFTGWTLSLNPHWLQNLAFSSKMSWAQFGHFIMGPQWSLQRQTQVGCRVLYIRLWLWGFHFLFCGKRTTYFNVRRKMTNLRKVTCLEFLLWATHSAHLFFLGTVTLFSRCFTKLTHSVRLLFFSLNTTPWSKTRWNWCHDERFYIYRPKENFFNYVVIHLVCENDLRAAGFSQSRTLHTHKKKSL